MSTPGERSLRSRSPADPEDTISSHDEVVVDAQLGRPPRVDPRGRRTAARAATPTWSTTEPRLHDGTPFPTMYYLTCPRAASLIGTLEASGLMREMTDRLPSRPDARGAVPARRTSSTSAARAAIGDVPGDRRASRAGGMPDRVKCLHVLAGHSLAQGPASTRSATRCSSRLGRRGGCEGPCVVTAPEDGQRVTRVAAIDCGTNTIRLLIADLDPRRAAGCDARPRDAHGPARPGRRPHRTARRRRRWSGRSPRSTSTPG